MTSLRPLLAEIDVSARGEFTALRFRRRNTHIYTVDLKPGVTGWFAMGRVADRRNEMVSVSPNVGVRHELVHIAADEAAGRDAAPLMPTVMTSLGRVSAGRYRSWNFRLGHPVAPTMRALRLVLSEFGLAYMSARTELPDLLNALYANEGAGAAQLAYFIPIVHLLLGQRAAAMDALDNAVEHWGDDGSTAAANLRRYALAVREKVEGSSGAWPANIRPQP